MSEIDNTDPNDRLIALERLAADQDQTIQDLSEMVAKQWQDIDTLKAQVHVLRDRLKRAEDRLPDEAPTADQKPPHY